MDIVKSIPILGSELKKKHVKEISVIRKPAHAMYGLLSSSCTGNFLAMNCVHHAQVVTNFIHNNPHFKRFEQEAVKDAINKGVFGFLGCNTAKYFPHPIDAVSNPPGDKDKETQEAERVRKGKEKAPLECKRKKVSSSASKKLLS
ncbi:hypothetical protein R1flu_004811 [Riccia fluitans]|uniref:Uncharacterized protein n=1 Tax=Riccia fluitans TaxID=41844 RepID=A0ABD1YRC7_9MARC